MITIRKIDRALVDFVEPAQPKDYDCMKYAPKVTDALRAHGIDADDALVVGWVEDNVVLYMHQVTRVGDFVVDFTARQFRLRAPVPARWVTAAEIYCTLLAEATGVAKVTFVDVPPGQQVTPSTLTAEAQRKDPWPGGSHPGASA